MKKNIILIGMPAVGKSTIGVILAKILGYHFLDSDILIQEREGCLLKEIIEKKGVEEFQKIENTVNTNIQTERTVIATGGSAVYGKEAMDHFRGTGTVIYLKEDYEVLRKRLKDMESRGVVLKEGQTLADLYKERTPLYEKYAHIIINEQECTAEETIRKILEKLG